MCVCRSDYMPGLAVLLFAIILLAHVFSLPSQDISQPEPGAVRNSTRSETVSQSKRQSKATAVEEVSFLKVMVFESL